MIYSAGDGSSTPPVTSREVIEQQRVSNYMAVKLRGSVTGSTWINIQVDVSPTLTRFVVHYGNSSRFSRSPPKKLHTVEVDFGPGHPINDKPWVNRLIDWILQCIEDEASDLYMPQPIDYLRLVDVDGQTLFEKGTHCVVTPEGNRLHKV